MSRTEAQTRRLLFRQGMYLFEKTDGVYTLIHRSQSGSIVRTAVEQLAGGDYRIIRPTWTDVSGAPFASIQQLSRGLNKMGLSLQSRIP